MINVIITLVTIVNIVLFIVQLIKERKLKQYESDLNEIDLGLLDLEETLTNKMREFKHAIDKYNNSNKSINDAYLGLIDPCEVVKGMSYDEFIDWLELGTKDDILQAIKVFEEKKLVEHVKIMNIYLDKMK